VNSEDKKPVLISYERLYLDPELTDTEKLTCAAIISLSAREGYCYAGNEYIARMFDRDFDDRSESEQGKRIEAIRRRIRRLIQKKILKNIGTQRNRKLVFVREEYRQPQQDRHDMPEEAETPPENGGNEEAFATFWEQYPRRDGKKTARSVFDRLNSSQVSALLEALPVIVEHYDGKERGFIPLPATFLRQERWEDEAFQKKIAQNGAAERNEMPEAPDWVHAGLEQVINLGDGAPEDAVLFGEGRRLSELFGMSPEELAGWIMDYELPEFWRRYRKISSSVDAAAA